MKTLKIVSLALIAVMAIGILASCVSGGYRNSSNNIDSSDSIDSSIVGTWESSLISFTFEKDGTGKYTTFGFLSIDMTYKIKGNELWITSSMYGYEEDEVYTFQISDNKLRLISSIGIEAILTKK